ncbi:uncharacterized protein LOC128558040 [Mercenaria mercenaria]|uniref:uncharacterized protein LOC128558040 n=1 Tax=Mercenaria mercenaria TaxID=6596 RepID=UPI00234F843F|nr:uncharacterized protein LOC128558040 [Mercenaria mercenaria]
MTTYSIRVRTGVDQDSGTANRVYIAIYGETSDTGIIELKRPSGYDKQPFQTGHVDEFTYETVDIGNITMVMLYHFGTYLYDMWYLEDVAVQTSESNQSTTFVVKSWIRNEVADSQLGVSLPAKGSVQPYYVNKRSCSENMFQCLDGYCIPKSLYCDHSVHCHGPFHEDEPLICSPRNLRRSCLEVLVDSNSREDYYNILFRNNDKPYEIHCSFRDGKSSGEVVSKIHSNFGYLQNVTSDLDLTAAYDIDDQGIDILKQNSDFCLQRLEVECIFTSSGDLGKAVKFRGNNGKSFQQFTSYCKTEECKCKRGNLYWATVRFAEYLTDEIYITDMDMLPIRNIKFSLRRPPPTKFRFRLHPLECFESITSDERLTCNSGEQYDPAFHCVLEYDLYGAPSGCRDFSHITDCGEEIICGKPGVSEDAVLGTGKNELQDGTYTPNFPKKDMPFMLEKIARCNPKFVKGKKVKVKGVFPEAPEPPKHGN